MHYAHLLLAESCREQCHLDEVWLLPAASAPHKLQRNRQCAKHRVEMLRLAVGGHRALQVSTLEIDRGGISYTFETLEAIHQQAPETELFFLMGADSLEDLPNWRQPERICELAVPVVVRRQWITDRPTWRLLRHLVDAEPAGIQKLPGHDANHRIGQQGPAATGRTGPEYPIPYAARRGEVYRDQRSLSEQMT